MTTTLRASGPDPVGAPPRSRSEVPAGAEPARSFHEDFVGCFVAEHPRLVRYLARLSGEPELAADLAQDAFLRLYRRGALPGTPRAWLVTVATNLLRNARSTRSRRRRLLTVDRGRRAHSDPAPSPGAEALVAGERDRARRALDALPERDRQLLLLRAEGYRYRDIAAALDLNEASVGTLLARARRAFRRGSEEASDAPG